jgi:phosphatidylglycerophosphate synthase
MPNTLTLIHLVLTPPAAYAYYVSATSTGEEFAQMCLGTLAVLGIFGLMLLDAVDGMWARRFQVTSRAGWLLDPIADRVATVAICWALYSAVSSRFPEQIIMQIITGGVAALMLELSVITVVIAALATGRKTNPERYGKLKFAAYDASISVGLIGTLLALLHWTLVAQFMELIAGAGLFAGGMVLARESLRTHRATLREER